MEADVGDVVLADGELQQLGGHRLALEIDEVAAPAVRPLRELDAVGDRGLPGGTSKRMSKLALSRGWSLDGRNRCAKFGCGAVAEPCGWKKNAVVEKSSEFGLGGRGDEVRDVTMNGARCAAAASA